MGGDHVARLSRGRSPLTLIVLAGLFVQPTAQRTRQLQLQLPAGQATLTYEETDDPDAVAAAFVRANGVEHGAGCTADPSCVAERIADRLRALHTEALLEREG